MSTSGNALKLRCFFFFFFILRWSKGAAEVARGIVTHLKRTQLTNTHSWEEGLHVLIGVCYRCQVHQISVKHLLVPDRPRPHTSTHAHTEKERERECV